MITCLITRTQPGALMTQALLEKHGYNPICVPAAIIVPTQARIDTSGVQALLMTSAAAARSIQVTPLMMALPVYAVGDATAEAAKAAGFNTVISAGGDGATLAVLAADRMKAGDGALLHLRGQEVAGDVTAMLSACGFETRFIEVYQTHDDPAFRADIAHHLKQSAGLVLFHSPAGARRFALAIDGAGIDLRGWGAAGLSHACVLPLQNMGFEGTFYASQPDEAALVDAIFAYVAQSRP
jgi:uroporphyrinogen-III synthase